MNRQSCLRNKSLLKGQPDVDSVKPVASVSKYGVTDPACFFRIKQRTPQGKQKRWVQVLDDLHNYYAVKRHRDLLHHLNRCKSFVHFYEIRRVEQRYLLFFEDAGKQMLAERVSKKGPLSSKQAERFLKQTLSALEMIHDAGFVHAGIRPETVLADKKCKHFHLMDWRSAMPSVSGYETECLPSDNRYTPPERLNGIHNDKSDFYQLGCTLYFALTGKHIYRLDKESDSFSSLWAHVHYGVRKPEKLPAFWRDLIVWMVQKDPGKRPDLKVIKKALKKLAVPKAFRALSSAKPAPFPKDAMSALADEHYDFALYQMARRYEQEQELESAFNLYESGASRSYSHSVLRLGLFYLQGICVDPSYDKAQACFLQALKKGHPEAAYRLAVLYEDRGEKESERVMNLYRFAAQRGHLTAQYALGVRLLNGPVERRPEALGWLRLAAWYGHPDARKRIQKAVAQKPHKK